MLRAAMCVCERSRNRPCSHELCVEFVCVVGCGWVWLGVVGCRRACVCVCKCVWCEHGCVSACVRCCAVVWESVCVRAAVCL